MYAALPVGGVTSAGENTAMDSIIVSTITLKMDVAMTFSFYLVIIAKNCEQEASV